MRLKHTSSVFVALVLGLTSCAALEAEDGPAAPSNPSVALEQTSAPLTDPPEDAVWKQDPQFAPTIAPPEKAPPAVAFPLDLGDVRDDQEIALTLRRRDGEELRLTLDPSAPEVAVRDLGARGQEDGIWTYHAEILSLRPIVPVVAQAETSEDPGKGLTLQERIARAAFAETWVAEEDMDLNGRDRNDPRVADYLAPVGQQIDSGTFRVRNGALEAVNGGPVGDKGGVR